MLTLGFLESYLKRYGNGTVPSSKGNDIQRLGVDPEALELTNSPISAAVSAISWSRTHSPGDLGDLTQGGLQEACCRGFSQGTSGLLGREPQGRTARRAFRAGPDGPSMRQPRRRKARICYRTVSTVKQPSDDYIQYTVTVRDETPSPPLTVETAKPRMQLPLGPPNTTKGNLEIGSLPPPSACKSLYPFHRHERPASVRSPQ